MNKIYQLKQKIVGAKEQTYKEKEKKFKYINTKKD